MPHIESIIREINRDLVPEFESKLRAYLQKQDKEWLIEQIIRLSLDAHSLQEIDRKQIQEEEKRRTEERAARVKKLKLDEGKLREFVNSYNGYTREKLIEENLLLSKAPRKGKQWITDEFRMKEGTELLKYAKDILYGLLFGDENTDTHLQRTQRQLLTLTVPRAKAETLGFMKATTEIAATGTWQDPDRSAKELHSENTVLEIEYGDNEGKTIAEGIITALRLINNLEINEEVLYGRVEKVEQSTLVS